jgi:hypothetical protein
VLLVETLTFVITRNPSDLARFLVLLPGARRRADVEVRRVRLPIDLVDQLHRVGLQAMVALPLDLGHAHHLDGYAGLLPGPDPAHLLLACHAIAATHLLPLGEGLIPAALHRLLAGGVDLLLTIQEVQSPGIEGVVLRQTVDLHEEKSLGHAQRPETAM